MEETPDDPIENNVFPEAKAIIATVVFAIAASFVWFKIEIPQWLIFMFVVPWVWLFGKGIAESVFNALRGK